MLYQNCFKSFTKDISPNTTQISIEKRSDLSLISQPSEKFLSSSSAAKIDMKSVGDLVKKPDAPLNASRQYPNHNNKKVLIRIFLI